ncbi:MAG: right-handed parallel beta-helix repeat-containing protein [bacterium]|nr:right-handed parallel beta-helix repeat-containing protein [bacterium]
MKQEYKMDMEFHDKFSSGKPDRSCVLQRVFFMLLAVTLLLARSGPVSADTYYVKTNGNNSVNGLSWANAWKTITYAGSNAGAGDVVIVSNGLYSGQVSVISNGTSGNPIVFRAFQERQAVVAGGSSGFYLNRKNFIRIQGFQIKRAGRYGIFIGSYSTNNEITGNSIYSNARFGIRVNTNAYRNSILANQVWGLGQDSGIYLSSARNTVIRSNRLSYNKNHGVKMTNSCVSNIIAGNAVFFNSSDGIRIQSDTADNNFIISNNIGSTNQVYGIRIIDGDYNQIKYNQLHNNDGYGVFLYGTASCNYIIRNQIYSNTDAGIDVDNAGPNNNYILTNHIYGPRQNAGVQILVADYNTVQSNRVHNNNIGVYLLGEASYNNILGNNVYSNVVFGVASQFAFGFRNNNNIIGNNIWGGCIVTNQWIGIMIWDEAGDTIRSNRVHHNGGTGIELVDIVTNTLIVHNMIYSNGGNGIGTLTSNTRSVRIASNWIFGPEQMNGISLDTSCGITLEGNAICWNSTNGILLSAATNNAIKNNILSHNGTGVHYYSNSFSSLYLNSITSNNIGIKFEADAFQRFDRNNLQGNQGWAFLNLASPVRITNNWFGTTLVSGISNMISNSGGSSNFMPFRLFTAFDTDYGADTNPSSPVTGLSLFLTNRGQVKLRWENRPGSHHYNVYCKTNSGVRDLQHKPCSKFDVAGYAFTTNFLHSAPVPGRTNYYHITASDTYPVFTNESWYSAEARIYIPDTVPQWHSITALSMTQMSLAWRDLRNETSYTLFRNTEDNTNTLVKISGTAADMTNYSDRGLSADTFYYYWLRSYSNSSVSPYSPVIFTVTCPSGTEWISGTAAGSDRADLVWKNIPNETSYTLYRNSADDPLSSAHVIGLTADVTNFLDEQLTPQTTYYYWIKVFNLSGSSVFSAGLAVTLPEEDKIYDNLDGAVLAPNPYRPNLRKSKDLTFFRLTPEFELTVYSITGSEVARVKACSRNGRYKWNGMNKEGHALNPGMYICYLTNSKGQKKYLKLVIIR